MLLIEIRLNVTFITAVSGKLDLYVGACLKVYVV